MNDAIWKEFIESLYDGFDNNTEVLMVIGYWTDRGNEDIIEYVDYYTSLQEDTVIENFRTILKGMARYAMLRGGQSKFKIVHNHPNGNTRASRADLLMEKRIQVASRLIGTEFTGSYIYTRGTYDTYSTITRVGDGTETRQTNRIVLSNQFLEGAVSTLEHRGIRVRENRANEIMQESEYYRSPLNEVTLDNIVRDNDLSPYILVGLDEENNMRGWYELDKLQPNIANASSLGAQYTFGMSTIFRRDYQRLLVYDKRQDVERDNLGLSEDTRKVIKALGVVGYPINFFIH